MTDRIAGRDEELGRLQAENIDEFMENGPGLRCAYNVFVVARDRGEPAVLLGGLGALGVGQMWERESPRHKDYPGYEDAPDRDYVDPWAIFDRGSIRIRESLDD